SIAPENLRQVGSVRFDWEAAGSIPAITIGADDGAAIRTAVDAGKTVRAKIDCQITSVTGTGANVVGKITGERPETIVMRGLYEVYAGLEIVAQLFGGIIPTDIQGTYRSGVPTVSTAATNPYYHTVKDLPDQVDLKFLASSADDFDTALDFMMKNEPADFA